MAAQPILNERHETRVTFLKKDKDLLYKRLEDVDERLTSTKNTIQTLLSFSPHKINEEEKGVILDYLIEEKNYLSKRVIEIEVENKEALARSAEQKKKINEIVKRESAIEVEFGDKIEAVLKESKDKEEAIFRLGLKAEKINKEFKELAKNRLNSSINPKEIPQLLENKQNAIKRVISKVHEYSKYLEQDNATLAKAIEDNYKELIKLNSQAKFAFKALRPLEEFMKPASHNLVQADIRAKVESPPEILPQFHTIRQKHRKNQQIQSKLEDKFIKIESLCNELKIAEVVNQTLKEDKNYLLSSVAHVNPRKGGKKETCAIKHVGSFYMTHRRVVSNPLDYCSSEVTEKPNLKHESKNDLDLDISKELDDFSSVEERYYEVPGDSIIDDILDI